MNLYHKTSENKTDAPNKFCLYIGRWQPWHDGHQWLINQSLNEGKNVCIAIRDVPVDDKNPWPALEIEKALNLRFFKEIEKGCIKVIIVPDIESVNFGRGVGYDIIEHLPPADVADISATKIREQMKNNEDIVNGLENYDNKIKEFLIEVNSYLNRYSPDQLNLCLEAADNDFEVKVDYEGKLISKVWGKTSKEIYDHTTQLINHHLFSVRDAKYGFPIARAFARKYMNPEIVVNVQTILRWLITNKY